VEWYKKREKKGGPKTGSQKKGSGFDESEHTFLLPSAYRGSLGMDTLELFAFAGVVVVKGRVTGFFWDCMGGERRKNPLTGAQR